MMLSALLLIVAAGGFAVAAVYVSYKERKGDDR